MIILDLASSIRATLAKSRRRLAVWREYGYFNHEGTAVIYEDILYEVKNGVATISINRRKRYNALRGQTCEEMIHAILKAEWDRSIGVIVLTGAGNKDFCTGGDQSSPDTMAGEGLSACRWSNCKA